MNDGGIRLRTTKTSSGATAIQAVRYVKRKVVVIRHFGSAHTPHEQEVLLRNAESWLADKRLQPLLLSVGDPSVSSSIVNIDQLSFSSVSHPFARETFLQALKTLGFLKILDEVTADFIVMRLLEPSSKRRALDRLRQLFGVVYGEQTAYRTLKLLAAKKDAVERLLVAHATRAGEQTLSLVLYDVTTLYFETFREDEDEQALRKTGFSKDNKPQQPQIVIGLLVTPQGFPLGYEIFKGSTFEGHTMLPVLDKFRQIHQVNTCTVVADAGMLSFENMKELRAKNLSYIVGARVGNLSASLIEKVSSTLHQKDNAMIRIVTKHGDLLCCFSEKRFRKDKHDLEKQVIRATKLVASKEPGRRAKFVKTKGTSYTLNAALVEKTQKLLGIKGYVTNIPTDTMSNEAVITHYRSLWHVEQTFRMAKSDLKIRPVFHHSEDAIRAHVLLCIIALVVQKHLEQITGLSLQRIRDALLSVTEATLTDSVTGRTFKKQSALSENARCIIEKLNMSY